MNNFNAYTWLRKAGASDFMADIVSRHFPHNDNRCFWANPSRPLVQLSETFVEKCSVTLDRVVPDAGVVQRWRVTVRYNANKRTYDKAMRRLG